MCLVCQTWISLQCFGVSFFALLKVNWRQFRMWCSRETGEERVITILQEKHYIAQCTLKVQKCANSKMRQNLLHLSQTKIDAGNRLS